LSTKTQFVTVGLRVEFLMPPPEESLEVPLAFPPRMVTESRTAVESIEEEEWLKTW
jgi:hypothetical protein